MENATFCCWFHEIRGLEYFARYMYCKRTFISQNHGEYFARYMYCKRTFISQNHGAKFQTVKRFLGAHANLFMT
jgi:hypothetical protein